MYYNKPEIRVRLEAVLEHLLSLQKEANDTTDGQFPEYGKLEYNLSATAFFTKFIGQTTRFLNEAKQNDPDFVPIDRFTMERVVKAQRKAIMSVLSDDSLWNEGRKLSSQWEAVLSGALAYLQDNEDEEVLNRLTSRLWSVYNNLQSPAGYYYENNMPDWFHNMNTHISNINDAWTFLRNNPKYDELRDIVIRNEKLFWEWVSYNVIADGDLDVFAMNAGISSRTRLSNLTKVDCGIAEVIPVARAFSKTKNEKGKEILTEKANYTKMWPAFPDVRLGETMGYSPFAFSARSNFSYNPDESEREEAILLLPYVAEDNFNHIRKDGRRNLGFSFYRRPTYYAAFNEGKTIYYRQNMGLGFVWHPEGGIFISSQNENNSVTDSDGFPNFLNVEWGTREYTINRPMKEKAPFEASEVIATYSVNGTPYSVSQGVDNMPDGDVTLTYGLGENGARGNKTVTFKNEGIEVSIRGYNGIPGSSIAHPSKFIECIPLMIRSGDKFESTAGYFKLTRGRAVMEIFFDKNAHFSMENKPISFGEYKMALFMITADTNLNYNIKFSIQEPKLRENDGTILNYNTIRNIFSMH